MESLFPSDLGSQEAAAFSRQAARLLHDVFDPPRHDLDLALGAHLDTGPREEEAQKLVNLGYRSHR